MNQVYVALREGDGDAGGGEGIVSPFIFGLYIVSPAMILGEGLAIPCFDLRPGLWRIRPERMISRQT